jgi:hypothetical protein
VLTHGYTMFTLPDPPPPLEHKSRLIAPRRMFDRDRAELERRRHSWTSARVGHPPLPIEPIRIGATAHRLIEQARAWAERAGSR